MTDKHVRGLAIASPLFLRQRHLLTLIPQPLLPQGKGELWKQIEVPLHQG